MTAIRRDATKRLTGAFGDLRIVDLATAVGADALLPRMPWCHRVLLENALRQRDPTARAAARDAFVAWLDNGRSQAEISFAPLRILMHDTTCGPALMDIAAMRDVLAEAGAEPEMIHPALPVATSVFHSIGVVEFIGVLGRGVGGSEAEGVMFGVPVSIRVPEVFGVRLIGALPDGVLATDLARVATERVRQAGVFGECVEFFGPGVGALSANERGVVANMVSEYRASTGCFPIDEHTLDYLRPTGRSGTQIALLEAYARANALWHVPDAEARYTRSIEIDRSTRRVLLAGPRRPQDRIDAANVPAMLRAAFGDTNASPPRSPDHVPADAVAIAAISSCTNTTDTSLLVTADLLAQKARRFGLKPPAWVKTSLAPGSPAAASRLARAGVLADLEALGCAIAGYGCTTCIGNSGPLIPFVAEAVERSEAKPIAVLSGNRNFPRRAHAQVDSALLASDRRRVRARGPHAGRRYPRSHRAGCGWPAGARR